MKTKPYYSRIKNSEYLYTFLLVISSLIILIIPILHMNDRTVPYIYNDEFGYWAVAANFRGYDWSAVYKNISYYSYGYGILLALFLFIFQNTGNAYMASFLLNAIWLCGSFWCLIYIAGKLKPDVNKNLKCIIALVCTLYINNVTQSYYTWPENLLFFLYCVIVCMLYTILKRPTVFKMIALGGICTYSYTVHQRTIGIIIAVGMTMVIFWITKKIKFVHLCSFALVFLICFAAANGVKGHIIQEVWENSTSTNSNNLEGQVNKLSSLFSIHGIKQFLLSLSGKLYYIIISTGFLIVLAIERLLKAEIDSLVLCFKNKSLKYIDSMSAFFLLSFAGTIVINTIFMIQPSGASHIVYGRYTENIIGPFLLIALLGFFKLKDSTLRNTIYFIIILLCGIGVVKSEAWYYLNGYAAVNDAGIARFVSPDYIQVWELIVLAIIFWSILNVLKKLIAFHKGFYLLTLMFCMSIWIYVGVDSANIFNNYKYKDSPQEINNCVNVIKESEAQSGIDESKIYVLAADFGYVHKYLGNGIQFALPEHEVEYVNLEDLYNIEDNHYFIVASNIYENIGSYEKIYSGVLYNVWIPHGMF